MKKSDRTVLVLNNKVKSINGSYVSPRHVRSNIKSEYYFTAADAMEFAVNQDGTPVEIPEALRTIVYCVLVLQNDFAVTGEAMRSTHESADIEYYKRLARLSAEQKVWSLMKYEWTNRRTSNNQPEGNETHDNPR